jgi:hypothetical protein
VRRIPALAALAIVACGTSNADDGAAPSSSTPPGATTPPPGAGDPPAPPADRDAASDASAPCTPSSGTWASMVPGPGQAGYDAALAKAVARYDRFHEAIAAHATGLAATVIVSPDVAMRAKVDHLLGTAWSPGDLDPTDDLQQYETIDPDAFVTYWSMATGMYAGAEMAADAYRYGVLRDRGGDCTELARARKMIDVGLDAFHTVVAIAGKPGSIARSIARSDLPGDGKAAVTPLFDPGGAPLPATKNNGTWRADNSSAKSYPTLIWMDSCSRDMLFGWTLGIAAMWEVIAEDPSFDPAKKTRLQDDARSILVGLETVRPTGKDLEIWDPDGRRTLNGNMHESSVDREYIIQNGVASMMALGEVAGLVSVVDDAPAKAYLAQLTGSRGLPTSTTQSMSVIALGGDQTNYSSYNMLFMTAWMAHRYVQDASIRTMLKNPVEHDLYAPLFGLKPSQWKQSFFDFVVAASSGDAWAGGSLASTFDAAAVARGLDTLVHFPAAPYYAPGKDNCDANEIAAGVCTLLDGVTVVKASSSKGEIVADVPVPIALRPPSNYFWRSNPFQLNGIGDANTIYPGSDLRLAYWLGRYVRIK